MKKRDNVGTKKSHRMQVQRKETENVGTKSDIECRYKKRRRMQV